MTHEDKQFLTRQEVFNAHAEFGRLDKEMVRKGMGPNWPRERDRADPDIFKSATQ